MRTYLIDEENNEVIIDLHKTIVHSSEFVEYCFGTLGKDTLENKRSVFVRKLAGSLFCSIDKIKWEKIPKEDLPPIMLNVNRVFKTYRGYKPSGLYAGGDGGLVTNMPGKVIKILVKKNTSVKKGDTLVILEAMKMENEVKANKEGIVKTLFINEGDTVKSGFLMLEIE